jgi:hypothetical protein
MGENMKIESIERATSKSWDEWLVFMDGIGAKDLNHHEIATKVLEQLMGTTESPAWWAQSVTVAYEQHIGRRLPGQQPDGTFQTSASQSTKLGMEQLMDAWTEFAAGDPEILDAVEGDVRTSGTEKRLSWRAKLHNATSVIVTSEPKPDGAASIVVQHTGSQTQERNNEAKAKWSSVVERFLANM